MTHPTIAIFGAGAVGAYFGGRLAEAGLDVSFIARGKHLDAIRAKGLEVTSVAGDFVVQVRVTESPADIGPVDAIFLGVKAWQLPEVVDSMRPMIGPKTAVVPLQNGVEAPDTLRDLLGDEHALGGLCQIAAHIDGPGRISHVGAEPVVRFGELDNVRTERVEALRAAFDGAKGAQAEVPDDIHVALWQKFMLICPWSGLGAVTRAPAGAFRSEPRILTTHPPRLPHRCSGTSWRVILPSSKFKVVRWSVSEKRRGCPRLSMRSSTQYFCRWRGSRGARATGSRCCF